MIKWANGDSNGKARKNVTSAIHHVIPENGHWVVRREGAKRASSTHPTKTAALEAAKRFARSCGSKVVVHKPDGFGRLILKTSSKTLGTRPVRNPVPESRANQLMYKIWKETHEEYLNSKGK